jgi:hypothetical protein
MTWRFRRSLRLGPLRLNFAKSGLSSVSLGGRGASLNVPIGRAGGTRATAGLPGTGLSYSSELGHPSTSQRRQAQRGSDGQPTTQQLVDLLAEGLLGPNSAGECLWHQHGIGLVAVLMDRPDTPRNVLEACQLCCSFDRAELHVRRGRGPADSLARARQVLEAAQAVIAYGRQIGLVAEEG